MSAATETAYAKINLALHVRERMADGYHRIETIFAFCEDGDELAASPFEHLSVHIQGEFSGHLHAVDGEMVSRAATRLLLEWSRANPAFVDGGAQLTLEKRLPVAAGIGGGSADAAAALRLLNRLWGLGWPLNRLADLGKELGADVPACVHSRSMRGHGKGDQLEPVDFGLAGTPVLLVNPRVEVSTADVFARWDGVDRGPLGDWRSGRNDLEAAARRLAPQIGSILAWLSAQPGADFVRLSGSGATCFALFDSEEKCGRAAEAVPREWWRLATRLR